MRTPPRTTECRRLAGRRWERAGRLRPRFARPPCNQTCDHTPHRTSAAAFKTGVAAMMPRRCLSICRRDLRPRPSFSLQFHRYSFPLRMFSPCLPPHFQVKPLFPGTCACESMASSGVFVSFGRKSVCLPPRIGMQLHRIPCRPFPEHPHPRHPLAFDRLHRPIPLPPSVHVNLTLVTWRQMLDTAAAQIVRTPALTLRPFPPPPAPSGCAPRRADSSSPRPP